MGARVCAIKYPRELHAVECTQRPRGARFLFKQRTFSQCVSQRSLGRQHGGVTAPWYAALAAPVVALVLARTPPRLSITDRERSVLDNQRLARAVGATQQDGPGPPAEKPQISAGVHQARDTTGRLQGADRAVDGVALGDAAQVHGQRATAHRPALT